LEQGIKFVGVISLHVQEQVEPPVLEGSKEQVSKNE